MKHTLTHIIHHEKTIFDKKKKNNNNNNLKGATWRLSTEEKPSNILRSKKAYGLKISESIIYIKGYFYTFFSTLKYIEVQSNKVIVLAKTLRSFN